MDIRDDVLKYSLTQNKRRTKKEKIRFLRSLSSEARHLGYAENEVSTKVAKINRKENYNLYIGNVEEADTVLTTYFDTPPRSVLGLHYKVGDARNNYKWAMISQTLPFVVYTIFELMVIALLVFPMLRMNDVWQQTTAVILAVLLIGVSLKLKNGLSQSSNLSNSTASIILLLSIMRQMTAAQRKRVAFVFTDNGMVNNLGLKVAANFISYHAKKEPQIIYFDSIGDARNIRIFHDDKESLTGMNNSWASSPLNTLKNDEFLVKFTDCIVTNGAEVDGSVIPDDETTTQHNFDFKKLGFLSRDLIKVFKPSSD